MKRIFEHPPENATGKKYWRSLDELADTAAFRSWLEREFPAGAAELEGDGLSRRSFLKLMGASMALAGVGMAGCRRPEAFLVPYTKSPEWIVPGKILQYATSIPRRGGGQSLLATTHEGRPIRVDGNPLRTGFSGSDLITQASVLDVYDPDRSRTFLQNETAIEVDAFLAAIGGIRAQALAAQGAGLAILWAPSTSPTRARLQAELHKQFPQLLLAVHDPIGNWNEQAAIQTAFGGRYQLRKAYEKADVILAVESDFLGSEEGGTEAIQGFSRRRKVRKTSDTMNRLYVIESRFTTTGGNADHRLRLAAQKQATVLAVLAQELVALGAGANLGEVAGAYPGKAVLQGERAQWIQEAARDLWSQRGKALVVAGDLVGTEIHQLVLAINDALGAFGSSLIAQPALEPESRSVADVAAAIRAGKVQQLILAGVNPGYDAPADLRWSELQKSIPTVVHLGYRADETAALGAQQNFWHAPEAHYLESWGDLLAADGTYLTVQPMILPLFGGLTDIELAAVLSGLPRPQGPELVQETFKGIAKTAEIEHLWKKTLHDGYFPNSSFLPVAVKYDAPAAAAQVASVPAPAVSGIEVVFYSCPKVTDGRYANNGWLQEVPDTMTKVVWDNVALISPATAQALGLTFEQLPNIFPKELAGLREIDYSKSHLLTLEANGQRIKIVAFIAPGQADDSIAVALGYGRTHVGRVGNGVGFNVYPLRTTQTAHVVPGVQVTVTGEKYLVSQTQTHQSMEGRALVREATLDQYQKEPNFAKSMGPEFHPDNTLYNNPSLTNQHQWGMVIDLSSCVGCNSCVVACQSENNIPIVGKDQVFRGRQMHWIRIDRYYADEPADPQMFSMPVLCQHCENAPCEAVCPVNATVHSDDGLSVVAYNRCIGTRYCANNCPYKVRRFNFFDYNKRQVGKSEYGIGNLYLGPLGAENDDHMVEMQKNPNVTVRMRGVIEKCTFCIQRIEEAKIDALVKAGPSADTKVKTDSFQTACQTACPAEAIIFGNIADPDSEVSKLKGTDREYGLLDYLNTRPRVTYLARLRNPNPAMPGADKIGIAAMDLHVHS